MNQGQGIAFNVNATNTAFAQTYPQTYPAPTTADQRSTPMRTQRWQDAMAAFQQTLQVQAQVAQNVQADTDDADRSWSTPRKARSAICR